MDWKERLKNEKDELEERIGKLMIYLDGEPECSNRNIELLEEHLYYMKEYDRLLVERMKLNGIE